MNVLASKIKKEFYANTKRGAEESLEAGLAEANKTLADLAEQGNGEYVGRLSMVCGTYRNNKFYLSQIGHIKSLLIREGRIMEIVKDEGSKRVSPKRAFNNIASGELADGDLVFFTTEGLFNILSLEKLRQLGASMKLEEFAHKLQEEIEEEDSDTVSALLIEIEGEKKKLIEHAVLSLQEEPALADEALPEKSGEREEEGPEAEKVPLQEAIESVAAEKAASAEAAKEAITAEESLQAALEGKNQEISICRHRRHRTKLPTRNRIKRQKYLSQKRRKKRSRPKRKQRRKSEER
jgi:serine/threonine protein phosphatase PrpC